MKKVFAKIYFLSRENGGRSQPLPRSDFGCPVFFDEIPNLSSHAYDCRFVLPENIVISPGDAIDGIEMKFLSEDVIPFLYEGINFSLWEGKKIAQGEISSLTGA